MTCPLHFSLGLAARPVAVWRQLSSIAECTSRSCFDIWPESRRQLSVFLSFCLPIILYFCVPGLKLFPDVSFVFPLFISVSAFPSLYDYLHHLFYASRLSFLPNVSPPFCQLFKHENICLFLFSLLLKLSFLKNKERKRKKNTTA